MFDLNKRYKYLIRVWTWPNENRVLEQFIFQSNFNPEEVKDEADFWYELYKEHPSCINMCTNWEFLFYSEIGELVS